MPSPPRCTPERKTLRAGPVIAPLVVTAALFEIPVAHTLRLHPHITEMQAWETL